MQSLREIRAMLQERGLSPKKSLGQNFLIDHNLIRRLVHASGVGGGELVLEVGPGTGTLTEELLAQGCRVIACELDAGLAAMLRDRFAEDTSLTLIEGDCLASKRTLSPELARTLGDQSFTLVANLPYAAGTPLLLTLLTRWPNCRAMHVTVQKEVGDRLLAAPGAEAYGSISVIVGVAAVGEQIATLPPECFWPRPKVKSVMLSLVRKGEVATNLPRLADVCQRLFTQRRKQVSRACRNLGLPVPDQIDPTRRVSQLSPADFVLLSEAAPIV